MPVARVDPRLSSLSPILQRIIAPLRQVEGIIPRGKMTLVAAPMHHLLVAWQQAAGLAPALTPSAGAPTGGRDRRRRCASRLQERPDRPGRLADVVEQLGQRLAHCEATSFRRSRMLVGPRPRSHGTNLG